MAHELQLKGLGESDIGEIVSESFGTDIPLEQDEFTNNQEEAKQEVSIQSFHETVIKYGNPLAACNQEQSFNPDELVKNDIKQKTAKHKKKKGIKNHIKKDIIKQEKQAKTENDGQDFLEKTTNDQKKGKNISNDLLEQINLMLEKQQNHFSCKVCGYNTRNKGHANEHVEKHIEGLEYPCNICSKILRYLILHVIHPKKYP